VADLEGRVARRPEDQKERAMMSRFILGAIVGAIAVYVWGEELRRFANTKGRTARVAAADTLQSVQETAEGLLDTAKEQVSSTLQAGQDAIRPTRTGRR
jgi:hypothetical protein